jgi:hypothetical protein
MLFVAKIGKPLLIGWINQLNVSVYSRLNITAKGKRTATILQGISGMAFVVVTTQ